MQKILLSSTPNDAHSWNLAVLSLWLGELGLDVRCIGPCTPPELATEALLQERFDAWVISSVNGHGIDDAATMLGHGPLRLLLLDQKIPVYLGGQLNVTGRVTPAERLQVLASGVTEVFEADELARFRTIVGASESEVSARS